jgi:hypothetical protein
MNGLNPADLLALWEDGARLHSVDRAIRILGAVDPLLDAGSVARLPLGERDALLLTARQAVLGDLLEAHAACPDCGERVEFELSCAALIGDSQRPPPAWQLEAGGTIITLRPIDSLDAAVAASSADVEAAYEALLSRIVVAAECDGESLDVGDLSPETRAAVSASLASHDEHAELLIDLACPACDHRWDSVLDIASFLWAELASRVQRLLLDVHALAAAYGWREHDILTLGPTRRAAYVALVNG